MTEETNTDTGADEDPEWLKKLRKDAKEASALRAEVQNLRRGAAMDELGIPKTGAGKLFRKTWDGDPDDLDALRSAAAEYELIPTDTPAPEQEAAAAVAAADSAAAVADAASPTQPTVDALLEGATSLDEIERIARDAGIAASQA